MDLQTPITTQEQLDEIIKGRLDREKEKHAKELEGFKNLEAEKKTLADELAGIKQTAAEEATKHAAEVAALTEKVQGYEKKEERNKIALENGLTAEAAQFITGTTREEMKAQAEALKRITAAPSPGGMFDDPAPATAEERRAKEEKEGLRKMLGTMNLNNQK